MAAYPREAGEAVVQFEEKKPGFSQKPGFGTAICTMTTTAGVERLRERISIARMYGLAHAEIGEQIA